MCRKCVANVTGLTFHALHLNILTFLERMLDGPHLRWAFWDSLERQKDCLCQINGLCVTCNTVSHVFSDKVYMIRVASGML